MPRAQRIEYEGARYHVMSRGDRKEDIVNGDEDRRMFVKTLGEAAGYAGWEVHAYCVMRNHFHLVVETPKPTLVKGMQWMLGTYTARFNARHKLRGHLFSGRYKAIVVDDVGEGYLRRVCDYTHLNPVRAGIVGPEEALESYCWSSYPMYLTSGRERPAWIRVDRLMGEHGVRRDTAAGRREFARRTEFQRDEEDAELRRTMARGWRFGSEDFLERLAERMTSAPGENHEARQAKESLEVRARKMVDEQLRRRKLSRKDLSVLRKGDRVKIRLAEKLHRETPMTLRWIAEELKMGSWRYVSFLLYQERKKSDDNKV